MHLTLGSTRLVCDRPLVMGVVNVTPDSFSDGGEHLDAGAAIRHGLALAADGADILDIGGESTRPGAAEVPVDVEIARVVPVIEALAAESDAILSVDTSKPAVMRAAVGAGASLINDIYALRRDGALAAARDLPAAVCLMHMLGTPRTMQSRPAYDRLPGDVVDFLAARLAACEAAGIARDRLLVDPGFGFGKTDAHNLALLAELRAFAALGRPLLVGWSRKRTLGNLTGRGPKARVAAGVAAAVLAVERGAHIVRTHDVAATADALKVVAASATEAATFPDSRIS